MTQRIASLSKTMDNRDALSVSVASQTSKFSQIFSLYDEENLKSVWGSFGKSNIGKNYLLQQSFFPNSSGLYVSKQLRMGRGTSIPGLGVFSLGSPECILNGVTNPSIRDKQNREPIFIVSKEFLKGGNIKPGLFSDGHLRPYQNQTNGIVPVALINYLELSHNINYNQDTCKSLLNQMISILSQRARKKQNFSILIPAVGTLIVKNQIAGVNFMPTLKKNTQGIMRKSIEQRVKQGDMTLNSQTLSVLEFQNSDQQLSIDLTGSQFLANNYGIQFSSQRSDSKSKVCKNQNSFNSLIHFNHLQVAQTVNSNFQRHKRILSAQIGEQNEILSNSISFSEKKPTHNNFLTKSLASQSLIKQPPSQTPSLFEQAQKKLFFWIRQNHFNSQDSFLEFCNLSIGRTNDSQVKLNLEQFKLSCQKAGIELSPQQIQQLFERLDHNKDSYVDFKDWSVSITDEKSHLLHIKDVIFQRKLHTDDVLKTMGLSRDTESLDLFELKRGLKALDISLNEYKADKLAKLILSGRDHINLIDLLNLFQCYEQEDKIFDPSWFKDVLYKLQLKFEDRSLLDQFTQCCDYFDEKNEGTLDVANFQTVLMRSQLGLSVHDINRIVRYIPKSGQNIDYYQFLRLIQRVDQTSGNETEVKDVQELAEKLKKYISSSNYTYVDFINAAKRWISAKTQSGELQKLTISRFSQFLQNIAFKDTDITSLQSLVTNIDLDQDGLVDEHDLRSFIEKSQYFDDINFSLPNQTRNHRCYTSSNHDTIALGTQALYPLVALDQQKFDRVLTDLRSQIAQQGMSNTDLFKFLDTNNDGFLNITSFSENINKIIKLSQKVSDGFFGFIDKQKIGLIDLKTFLRAMNQSCITREIKITPDSFDWEQEMIGQIRVWFEQNQFTVEDAFRVLDQNYNGEIYVKDLDQFLKKHIKIQEEEITSARINRLFKLMDQFKRGRVSLADFQRFLCEDFSLGMNQTIMGNKFIENISSFDWKLNARQQLGIVLTRQFENLTQSFEVISSYSQKLSFKNFESWVRRTNALNGFDLSDQLFIELFADLDPHKKGFLTENDWINAFGGNEFKQQLVEELKDTLNMNFKDIQKAYEFFEKHSNERIINEENFSQNLQMFFPKRFIQSDKEDIWRVISNEGFFQNIDMERFQEIIQNKSPTYATSFDLNRHVTCAPLQSTINKSQIFSITESGKQSTNKFKLNEQVIPSFENETLLDKVRRFFRSNNSNPNLIFQSIDQSGTGKLSNIQFKGALRQFDLGLNNREINQLISLCNAQGFINWHEFLKLLEFKNSDKAILERSKIQLQHISQLIYTFLLTPKDAFRQFDTQNLGYLTFDQFQIFMIQLFNLAKEEIPAYAIVKDLFEYIDQRRDGQIDSAEWMDIFTSFPPTQSEDFQEKPISVQLGKNRSQSVGKSPHLGIRNDNQTSLSFNFSQNLNNNRRNLHSTLDPNPFKEKIQNIFYTMDAPKPQNRRSFNKLNQTISFINNERTEGEESRHLSWERSQEFDKVLNFIGKNRKYLLDIFSTLENVGRVINFESAKKVIEQLLRNGGLSVSDDKWNILLGFAQQQGSIDYRFLLDVYKERIKKIDSHPINS